MWHPMVTAPKGGGAERVDDPNWVEPPKILQLAEGGEMAVGYWDSYYAEGGNGCTDGIAWDTDAGLFSVNYGAPIGWMELPPVDPALMPVRPKEATKEIRIAVAVDSRGNHNAVSYGGPKFGKRTQAQEDESALDCVWEGLDSDDPVQAMVWVTAEIPIPEDSVTVEGRVGEPCE